MSPAHLLRRTLMINTMRALPTTAMEARVSAVDSRSENACANAMRFTLRGVA